MALSPELTRNIEEIRAALEEIRKEQQRAQEAHNPWHDPINGPTVDLALNNSDRTIRALTSVLDATGDLEPTAAGILLATIYGELQG